MKYFGLIDCNNFFASCERVFRPDLATTPVAVLSNNDGVVVARTQQVKDMGVPMAAPYFKWKDVLNRGGAKIFSANFALYSDISKRIIHILEAESPEVEVYSIDESFVLLEMDKHIAENWARRVRAKVLKDIGVPVSVGIATSKTLAKAASEYAKKHPSSGGVCIIPSSTSVKYQEVLEWLPVGDIWGIGRRLGPKLNRGGIYKALELSRVSEGWARQQLSIRGEQTVRELRGEPCYGLNEQVDPQKTILVSRSFADTVRNLSDLEVAVASFVATMAHKLRKQDLLAASINVFASSARHKDNRVYIKGHHNFEVPTSDSVVMTKAVMEKLEEVFQSGVSYKRAGIYVGDLKGLDGRQMNLFSKHDVKDIDKEIRRGEAFEELSGRYGPSVIKTAAAIKRNPKSEKAWRSRADIRSPEYTTSWKDIAVIHAK